MSDQAKWHLLNREGQQMGPYTDEELVTYAGEGRISLEDMLWTEGQEDWIPAASVEGLFPAPKIRGPVLLTGGVSQAGPAPVGALAGMAGVPATSAVPATSSWGAHTGAQPTAGRFDPTTVGPLRLVAVGLSFLFWGTWALAVGVVLCLVGLLFAVFTRDGASTVGPLLLLVGTALLLGAYVLKLVGAAICINVPSASGAKGLIIACLCCELGGLLISLLGLPVGGWAGMAGLILIAVFLMKLAEFVGERMFAVESKSLIIHSSILSGLSILLPIILLMGLGAGLLVGAATGSGFAALGAGAILFLVLVGVTLFFVLSVLFKSIALFGGLRDSIRRGCFATEAALRQGSVPR